MGLNSQEGVFMKNPGNFSFTSESVGKGHPDKLCDQVSDAILDEALRQDADSRVAIETMSTRNKIIVSGEMTTKADIDIEDVVRKTVQSIGYTNDNYGLNYQTMEVDVYIESQSEDISQGVNEGTGAFEDQGAGDQGIMFGFATVDMDNNMPMPIEFSHQLLIKADEVREEHPDILRPDSKSQVTVRYENWLPVEVTDIVVSHQHSPDVSRDELEEFIYENIISPVIPSSLRKNARILINPTGRFVKGGPEADTGLTGRKIIVDTYGGMGRHGGGAFSGKDPSKVDRSAAYMCRWLANNIVASGLALKAEVQLSYAIGYAQPISVFVDTFNTSRINPEDIVRFIRSNVDLSPKAIIERFNLKSPIYFQTASYGHFGRDEFPWERIENLGLESLMEHEAEVYITN